MSETIYTWYWLYISFVIVNPWALVILQLIAIFCVWHFIYTTFYKAQEK
jgi:hypothetical protein